MSYWIFQSTIERQDLRSTLREGKDDTRLASRYRQQMSPGDLVYFWLAGPEELRGIYGWGTLLAAPYFDEGRQEFRVAIRYDRRLETHLPAAQIRGSPTLQGLMIFRAPQATNFNLSEDEAKAIADLMAPDERPDV
jgi:EVE domain